MGLMDILNGMQNGPHGQTAPGKGGMSPITMALLGLLAYKAYNKFNEGHAGATPNTAPANTGGMAGDTSGGGGQAGGLGGLLGGLLGGGGAGGALPGGLAGGLGGLLTGGAAGGLLSGGLGNLINQLQQAGHGDAAQSWVGSGPNQHISGDDLGKALGSDTVNTLATQTGMSVSDLLNGLAHNLPQLVNQLTPQGRVPNEHEMSKMI